MSESYKSHIRSIRIGSLAQNLMAQTLIGKRKNSKPLIRTRSARAGQNEFLVPANMQDVFAEITRLTDTFCEKFLNDEYGCICRKLTAALCRKHPSPLLKGKIDALVEHGQAQDAVSLYEVFFAGCYEKAEELDDSGGNLGMFAQELFISWIKARQKAKCSDDETVKYILKWMDKDDYGFCYDIEKNVVKALNKNGFLLFRKHFQDRLETAFDPFKDQPPSGHFVPAYTGRKYRTGPSCASIRRNP